MEEKFNIVKLSIPSQLKHKFNEAKIRSQKEVKWAGTNPHIAKMILKNKSDVGKYLLKY